MRHLARNASLLLAASALAIACGAGGRIAGEGPMITDTRQLLAFDEVQVDAPIDVILVRGDNQSVAVTTNANLQPYVKTEVKGERLTIEFEGNPQMEGGANVEIVIPELEDLHVTGAGNVVGRGFGGDKLSAKVSGSGNVTLHDLRADDLKLDVSGSGDVDVDGTGEDLQITLTSSGDVQAFDFSADDVQVDSKGSGEVRVMAKDKLKVHIKGAGSVYYRGDPEVDLKDEGPGQLVGDN